MPLDPQSRALVTLLDSLGPPIEDLTPQEARRISTERRLAAALPVLPLHDVQNMMVEDPNGAIPIRVYRPSAAPDLPVVVFFHGGGWVICDLDSHDGLCRTVARDANCVVVSIDYRLAPEAPFPAAVDDCIAATKWVAHNGEALGADTSRLAVMGDSAGGNLAAVVAQHMAAQQLVGQVVLRMQCLVYPVTDHDFETASYLEFARDNYLTRVAMQWYWDRYVPDKELRSDPRVAPLRAENLIGLPRTLIVVAGCDPLRDEGIAYAGRLAGAGTDVVLRHYDGTFHGFVSMGASLDIGRQALADVCAYLRAGFMESIPTRTA